MLLQRSTSFLDTAPVLNNSVQKMFNSGADGGVVDIAFSLNAITHIARRTEIPMRTLSSRAFLISIIHTP